MIYTVEGNSGDKVCINRRKYDDYFDGFGSSGGIQTGTIPSDYGEASGKDR